MLLVMLVSALVLTGCGTKSEEKVVEDLRAKLNQSESYRSHATMNIQSGEAEHQYDIEVWYQPPHYYRVALKNTGKDVSQIILRNDEGVFVLTPQSDKFFRFQSSWPDAHGQPYLYKTLMQNIVEDDGRQFEAVEDGYVFDVTADYKQNQALKQQRIQLNKKYEPEQMALLDADGKPLVEVTFDEFRTDVNFDSDAFDKDRNMTDWGEGAAAAAATPDEENDEAEGDAQTDQIGTWVPEWQPEGSELASEHKVATPGGEGILLRYEGEVPFTLLQQPTKSAVPVMANAVGEPVQLRDTVGVLLEQGDQKQLNWTLDGVDFQLTGALANEEMMKLADSLHKHSAK